MKAMLVAIGPLIPGLRRYARTLAGDSSADDLVQDCLERAVSHWQQRRETDARSWIFSILHNIVVDHLRRKARHGAQIAIRDVQGGQTTLADAPPLEGAVRHTELLRALDTLPDEQRAVLLLISVESVSYTEAARVLKIPIDTVKSRLAGARERLRCALEDGSGNGTSRGARLRRIK
jgi:RNA polymerase sigma-70 factor (ECF subfamily)